MKIKVISIGKTQKSYFKESETEYINRLNHYCSIEKIEIPELRNSKKLRQEDIKSKEGKLILDTLNPGDHVILLDENGVTLSSVGFSNYLQKKFNSGPKTIVFAIGGPYGFSDEVYSKSNYMLSLSNMTFSHQMVRTIFLEQLYRALTILKGEPYHHK